ERSADHLEAHRDLAILEIVQSLVDRDRIVRERLDAFDEFLVARAIELACLVREAARRLAALPHSAVDEEHVLARVPLHQPTTDHRRERLWLAPRSLARKADLGRRPNRWLLRGGDVR